MELTNANDPGGGTVEIRRMTHDWVDTRTSDLANSPKPCAVGLESGATWNSFDCDPV